MPEAVDFMSTTYPRKFILLFAASQQCLTLEQHGHIGK